jgi:hypothetical protein
MLFLGLLSGALLFSAHTSQAGTAELKTLCTILNGGTPYPSNDVKVLDMFLKSKSATEVANAVVTAIQAKPTSSSAAAAYSGEALKRADEGNFGTVLGQTLNANQGNLAIIFNPFPGNTTKNAQAKAKYIGTSAKLAATGASPFADWIDEFAFQMTASNQEAYDAAKSATASKTAVGLIVASRSNYDPNIDTDAERLALAQGALLPKNAILGSVVGQGLTASSLEISRYVGDSTTAPEVFAHDLANSSSTSGTKTTQPLLAQEVSIVTGTVTSNPTVAGKIMDAMFDGDPVDPPNLIIASTVATPLFKSTVKNATKLASKLAPVADIEQVEAVGVSLASRIGLSTTDTGKTKLVGINQSKLAAIVKGLVVGIATRATKATNFNGDNQRNRIDEIGEVAAYVLNAIKNLPVFHTDSKSNRSKAVSLVKTLLKTVITNSAKVYSDSAAQLNPKKAVVKDINFQGKVADDAAGSVGLTLFSLSSSFDPLIFAAIKDGLIKAGNAIAGKTLGPAIIAAINAGITNGNNGPFAASAIYEDGTIPGNTIDKVNNAETDIRTK